MPSRREFVAGLPAAVAAGSAGDLPWLTIEETSARIRAGKVSPVELAQACLRRIEKLNAKLNAFITVTAEAALAQARALEAEAHGGHIRGPLHGIPVALKDLFDTAGVRTTAASEQYRDRVPAEDAEVVARLKAGGAVLLGKLNMDEFAYNFTSETSSFGASHNPWNTRLTPGGSSGGSAIAVAAGMCHAALGSDTGGSIRLPAAFCSVTGLKPSYGTVSTRGVAPLAWSLDHVGPLCRTAADASHVLRVIAGARPGPRVNVKSLRIGAPRAVFFEQLDSEVDGVVDAALKQLAGITAGVRDCVLPPLARSLELPVFPLAYVNIITAEAYTFHEEMLKSHPERYHPGTRASIAGGGRVSAADYIRARRELDRLRAGASQLFKDADLFITPAAPAPAFELGKPADLIFLRNTAPWNLYGLPTISVPCGFTSAGLPVGMQITGPAGGDATVLAAAAAWQEATDWHTKRPPV